MEPRSEPTNTVWSFPFTPQDWEQTPPAVQAYLRTLSDEVAQLHDRGEPWKLGSHRILRPRPSRRHRIRPIRSLSGTRPSTMPRKAGGKLGHPGHRQGLLPPTTVQALRPARCACGNTTFALTTPYHTHQVIELPAIAMEVTHWVLHQGWCADCGRWTKAQVPAEHAHRLRPPVQCPHGGARRDIRERSTYGANLLCLRVAGPHQLGGYPEGARPCGPGHRAALLRRLPRRRATQWSTISTKRPGSSRTRSSGCG